MPREFENLFWEFLSAKSYTGHGEITCSIKPSVLNNDPQKIYDETNQNNKIDSQSQYLKTLGI